MTKKYIIFFSLGILLIISAIFVVLKRHQPEANSLFDAIPEDVRFIVDIKDYTKLRTATNLNNKTWEEVLFIHKQISLLDSLQETSSFLKKLLTQSPSILISGHSSGKNSIQILYYTRIKSTNDFKQIAKILEKTPGSVITERKFRSATILDVLLSSKKKNLSICHIHGVLMISESSGLIESAVRKLSTTRTPHFDKGLEELTKSAGKSALVNFYLKYDAIPLVAQQFFHPRYNKELDFIGKFGNWLELDLNVKQDILVFNGFSSTADSAENLQSVFLNQQPQKLEMFGKIPANANTFAILGISDIQQFFKDYRHFLLLHNIQKTTGLTDTLKTKYNINLTEDFAGMFESEAGIVLTETANDSAQHVFTLFRVKNNEIAESTLNGWVKSYAESTKSDVQEIIHEIPIDENFSAKIYRLTMANIPSTLFGSFFTADGNEYCVLSDNYLIFGHSKEALLAYIQNILSSNTLNTSIEFNDFSEYFSSQTNFFFYNKPSLSTKIVDTYLKQSVPNNLKTGKLNNLQAFAFQFNVNDGNIYNNVFIKYAPAKTTIVPKTTKTIWECRLEGNCNVKPTLVKNHLTGETEIFAQDDKNNIYLINKLGRVLWKQHIDDPILSDIYQIDYYRNRKLQYLFNTADKIYIIDRNGNTLKNFPVKLKEKATNGLAVFDYDKNRDYRLFLACADRKIHMLGIDGSPRDGWKQKETNGIVTTPVQHFRFNAADYLVFSDNQKVYIVNRKGKERVKPDKQFALSSNKVVLVKNANAKLTRFGISDSTGQVCLIDTKGKTSTLNLGKYPTDHYFDAEDLDGDGNSELILTSRNKVYLFSQSGEERGLITTDAPITHKPLFYEFSPNKYKIGIVSNDNEKIYLYNSNGELYKGFPLIGNSQFSVGLLNNSENRFNLIVGSNGNLLYNYSVQ